MDQIRFLAVGGVVEFWISIALKEPLGFANKPDVGYRKVRPGMTIWKKQIVVHVKLFTSA